MKEVVWRASVVFEPRDLWIGLFIAPPELGLGSRGQYRRLLWYVCIVPMISIRIERTEWYRSGRIGIGNRRVDS